MKINSKNFSRVALGVIVALSTLSMTEAPVQADFGIGIGSSGRAARAAAMSSSRRRREARNKEMQKRNDFLSGDLKDIQIQTFVKAVATVTMEVHIIESEVDAQFLENEMQGFESLE